MLRAWSSALVLGLLAGCGGGGGGGSSAPDTSAPRVLATIPSAGAIDVDVTHAIAAVFNEELWPTSVDEAHFAVLDAVGNPVAGSVTYGQRTATFSPHAHLAWSTHYTAILRAGIEDLAHNVCSNDMAWGFTTAPNPDTTPPQVVATDPLDGQSGVLSTALVHVWFSEAMDPATIDATTFLLTDLAGAAVAGSVGYDSLVATFTPSVLLAPSDLFTATITTGARDAFGNALASTYTWGFQTVAAHPGAPDLGFGDAGVVVSQVSPHDDWANGVIVQSDGKIVVGASTNAATGAALVRYLPDGSLDASFGWGGILSIIPLVTAMAQQPDGKLLVAGGVWSGTLRICLARYDADGLSDPTFGVNGLVITPISAGDDLARGIVLLPDGRIVALGSASGATVVLRYAANGQLDTTFGGAGGEVYLPISPGGLALHAEGVVVGGSLSSHFALARLSPDGSLDEGFGIGGIVTTDIGGFYGDWIADLAVQADGKIVAAGSAGSSAGYDFALARYTASGALDTGFGFGGIVVTSLSAGNDSATGILARSDGTLLVCGSAGSSDKDFALVRCLPNGLLDPAFGNGGATLVDLGSQLDEAYALCQQPDGRVVLAGRSWLATTGYAVGLARFWP